MTLPVLRLVRAEENPSDSGYGRTPGVLTVRWCPLVVYLQSADPPSSPLSSSPLCGSQLLRAAVALPCLPHSLTHSEPAGSWRENPSRESNRSGRGEKCVRVCGAWVCEWVCVWLPKLETVTYKRDTDGLLSYVGAEYAKTCVVVEPPPSSSFPSSSLVRPLLRCADCSEWILRPGAGLCFGCAAAPPRIQTVGRKRHHEELNLQPRPRPFPTQSRTPFNLFWFVAWNEPAALKDSLPTSPPVVYYQFAPEVYNKPGDARRQKMSSPRFKKDKEIIAEYESQVKGKGECAFGSGVVLLGGGD